MTLLAQPPSGQPSISKLQNSPTQAEIAAANQKKETEEAVKILKKNIFYIHKDNITDLAKKPLLLQVCIFSLNLPLLNNALIFQKEIEKISSKTNSQTEFTLFGLEMLKQNTENLSKEIDGLKVQWTQADEQVSSVLIVIYPTNPTLPTTPNLIFSHSF